MNRPFPITAVDWIDSTSPTDAWIDMDDLKQMLDEHAAPVRSCGWKVHEDGTWIVLATDYEPTSETYGSVTAIPKVAVISLTDL